MMMPLSPLVAAQSLVLEPSVSVSTVSAARAVTADLGVFAIAAVAAVIVECWEITADATE